MAIERACYVTCDECGDPAPVSVEGAPFARRLAKGLGYAYENGRDICPRCKRKLSAQPPASPGENDGG